MLESKPRCKRVKLGAPPPTLPNRDGAPVPDRAMRKYIFLAGHKTSAKAARELLGKSEYQRAVAAARFLHYADPGMECSVPTSGGALVIVFRTI